MWEGYSPEARKKTIAPVPCRFTGSRGSDGLLVSEQLDVGLRFPASYRVPGTSRRPFGQGCQLPDFRCGGRTGVPTGVRLAGVGAL